MEAFNFNWNESSIEQFWNIVSTDEQINKLYFTKSYARNIEFFSSLFHGKSASEHLKVLDYGCGPGYLSEHLARKEYAVTALDFSKLSCDKSQEKLQQVMAKNAQVVHATSLPTGLISNSFDIIYSIETYEHLLPEWIDSYFSELWRLVRPGGLVIISTPNNEDLIHETCICPKCYSKFHQYQHLRSVNPRDLELKCKQHRFKKVFCGAINLAEMNKGFSSSKLLGQPINNIPRIIRNRLVYMARAYSLRLKKPGYNLQCNGPHLFYVGTKEL